MRFLGNFCVGYREATSVRRANPLACVVGPRHPQSGDQPAGTQVFSTGQTSAQRGVSKCPSHSVHFLGSIIYMSFFKRIAAFGHSNSQAPHTVHCDATIL
jgi:hypothetical protein